MKQFFEQYGGIALGILALLVLIAMITPVGNLVKTSLQGTVQTFSAGMESQTDTMTESMKEAFENASILSGVVGNTYYFNGEEHPLFAEKGLILSEDAKTATDKNGVYYYRIYADVNVILNDSSKEMNGIPGLLFDVYKNNVLIASDAVDCVETISLKNNDEIKIKIKNIPDGYRIDQTEFIYQVYNQNNVFLAMVDTSSPVICVDMPIYAYTN